jgi:hypothetical protein
VTTITDRNLGKVDNQHDRIAGVAAMALSPTVAYDSPASRRFRFIAPLLAALGLVAASIVPAILLG